MDNHRSKPQSSGTPANAGHLGGGLRLLAPGTADSLPHIRKVVVEVATRCGFSDQDTAKIEMAVGEAVSNVIEHAYSGEPLCHDIEVRLDQFDDRLEIIITDQSPINFPAGSPPQIGVDEYHDSGRRRGLGLFIIHNFVDRVEHRFVGGQGNELRLVKFKV